MQLDDNLLTVFTAKIDDHDGTPVIQLPGREIDLGTISSGDTYQVALLPRPDQAGDATNKTAARSQVKKAPSSEPPVTEGEQLEVEIEDEGEQGDGIARVGPGYIVFVPDTDIGDRVTIEITKTQENFGFSEVVSPEPVTG